MSLYNVTSGSFPLASDIDQLVDIFNGKHDIGVVTFAPVLPAPTITSTTATAVAGTGMGVGVYGYKFTYKTGYRKTDGTMEYTSETMPSTAVTVTTTSTNKQVALASLPTTWPDSAVGLAIYRTAVGGSTYKLVTVLTVPTPSYTDVMADASLGITAPTSNTTGTTLSGTVTLSADPTTALGAATKQYVDNVVTTGVYPLTREVANLKAASTIANRVDGASGTFYDLNDGLNGGSAGKIDMSSTNATSAITATASSITVPVTGGTTGFAVGQEVTIFDDIHLERRLITAISAGVSLTFAAMTNNYKIKAQICRSSVIQDTINHLLKFNGWTYSTTTTNTAVNVVASAYDTSGNGGRKVVGPLTNGWLVSVVYNSSVPQAIFYKSTDNGTTWSQLCFQNNTNFSNIALSFYGNKVYFLFQGSVGGLYSLAFDASTVTNINQTGYVSVDSQTSFGSGCSIAIDSLGTLHAAWCSKNATYPNSFNIRYSKSTDGGVTWATVTQVSNVNSSGSDNLTPCIIIKGDGYPAIVFSFAGGSAENDIMIRRYNGTSWLNTAVYQVLAAYSQSNPCASVAPSGRIWCVWHGYDSTDTAKLNIRYSYSDDGGATWLAAVKLTSGNTYDQLRPVISIDKNNNVYVLWHGLDAATFHNIFRNIWTGSAFQGATKLTTNTTANAIYPSSIDNNTMDFNLLTPPMIYQDNQATAVKFSGTYIAGTTTPVLVEDVRYNVNPPANVSSAVAWVDHDADAGYAVDGALAIHAAGANEVFSSMTKSTAAIDGTHNEDQFVGSGTANAKATLRLTLTRNSTSLIKNISAITGAVGV